MENPTNVVAGDRRAAGALDREYQLPEDWRLARRTRANLLLIHANGVIQRVLELLQPDLDEPIATWRPGERLVLPPEARAGTMILQDVGALATDDQRRLLDFLERASGRTQIVSTTAAPLLPRVEAGAFNDTLYYRLNTVCVDVTT
jgi:hypothetical protein